MIGLLLPIIARLGVPERFQKLAAWVALILAAIALLWLAKTIYDRSIIREHEREIVEEVRDKTAKGNAAATEAANATKADVEEGNRRASEAAKESDDPLAAGLRELGK